MSNSSRPHGLQPTRLLCPWDFPGKRTGVGCHCLLHHLLWSTSNKTYEHTSSLVHVKHVWKQRVQGLHEASENQGSFCLCALPSSGSPQGHFLASMCVCVCVCVYAQSCPTLCNPLGYSPPGSPVHGIFQARILEWVAISYSRPWFPYSKSLVF